MQPAAQDDGVRTGLGLGRAPESTLGRSTIGRGLRLRSSWRGRLAAVLAVVAVGLYAGPPLVLATGTVPTAPVGGDQIDCRESEPENDAPAPPPPAVPATGEVSITGWFSTIWNGRPQYWLADDQGQRIRILLDEDVARPLGGPQAFNRRRVTVVGEVVSQDPRTVRVVAIEFAAN